jgi:hypothetical protein
MKINIIIGSIALIFGILLMYKSCNIKPQYIIKNKIDTAYIETKSVKIDTITNVKYIIKPIISKIDTNAIISFFSAEKVYYDTVYLGKSEVIIKDDVKDSNMVQTTNLIDSQTVINDTVLIKAAKKLNIFAGPTINNNKNIGIGMQCQYGRFSGTIIFNNNLIFGIGYKISKK